MNGPLATQSWQMINSSWVQSPSAVPIQGDMGLSPGDTEINPAGLLLSGQAIW
jgi:hypothetical protein